MPRKGQSLSVAAIEQMKESKLKRLLSKYDFSIAEPYLDININNGSRNRKVKFITLREFISLIKSGNSLLDIKKQGISRHLVSFFSNLCQGKIKLTKDQFINEYKSGWSLEDISEKYDVNREDITFLRQLYDIKATGATFQERKRTEELLTDRQKSILYGSMMGDAKRRDKLCDGYGSAVYFCHSSRQKDYLLWKYKEFENIASKSSLKATTNIDKRSEVEQTTWRFYTYANSDIETCCSEFYKSGEKEINRNILDKLDALSIAVWYQDDGTIDFYHRRVAHGIKKDIKDVEYDVSFCTDSFSYDSCLLIQDWFLEKFSIKTFLKQRKILDETRGYRVCIHSDDRHVFFDLIRTYILPMFMYKIDYKEYLIVREDREKGVILDDVVRCPLGADFSCLSLSDQSVYLNTILSYYRKDGLNRIIKSGRALSAHVNHVLNSNPNNLLNNEYISFSTVGNRFLLSFFPHHFEARAKGNKSPSEVFNNDQYLTEIIRSIIVAGYFPSTKKIMTKLYRYRGNKAVSSFMPCVAKAIYSKYCPDNANVLDFTAGFGGRLFGAIACKKVSSYVGIEIDFRSYKSLLDLSDYMRKNFDIYKMVNIINQDSIIGMRQFSDKSFDFCFTSPPYFDAEEYSDDEAQSMHMYPDYGDWFENYLCASINEARRVSKVVAINIANTGAYKIADDLRRYLGKVGIDFKEDCLRLPQYGGRYRYEPIFIM